MSLLTMLLLLVAVSFFVPFTAFPTMYAAVFHPRNLGVSSHSEQKIVAFKNADMYYENSGEPLVLACPPSWEFWIRRNSNETKIVVREGTCDYNPDKVTPRGHFAVIDIRNVSHNDAGAYFCLDPLTKQSTMNTVRVKVFKETKITQQLVSLPALLAAPFGFQESVLNYTPSPTTHGVTHLPDKFQHGGSNDSREVPVTITSIWKTNMTITVICVVSGLVGALLSYLMMLLLRKHRENYSSPVTACTTLDRHQLEQEDNLPKKRDGPDKSSVQIDLSSGDSDSDVNARLSLL